MQKRIGIIGLGEGKSILRAAVDSEFWETRMICDLNEDLCRQMQKEYGVPDYTTDYSTMLENPEIDAVGIYTPDPMHAEHIGMALNAGKHVICTKPLMTDLTEGKDLLELQRASGKQVLVGQSCRFFPTFRQQKADVEAGKTGRIRSIEAHYHGDKREGTSGKWGKKGGNDWIFTGLSHPVDLAYWHLGPFSEVTGFAVKSSSSISRSGPEDILHFVLKNKNGEVAQISGAFGTPAAHPQAQSMIECTVRGESGTLSAKYPEFLYFRSTDDEPFNSEDYSNEQARYFPFGGSMHHVGEFRNYLEYFGRCLNQDSEAQPNLQDGIHVVATLIAMKTAVAENRVVSLSEILERNNL
jgi:predicted dehydrogenase